MTGVAADEELLQGAENGRYKVVAKAEPYKNLPVSFLFCLFLVPIGLFLFLCMGRIYKNLPVSIYSCSDRFNSCSNRFVSCSWSLSSCSSSLYFCSSSLYFCSVRFFLLVSISFFLSVYLYFWLFLSQNNKYFQMSCWSI